MTTTKVDAARRWLTAQHILVDEEWLTECVEYLCGEGGEHSQQSINNLAREQWLLNDLKNVCPGSLPANLAAQTKVILPGRYVLQVNCALDVGTPAYQQYQKLKKTNLENIEETMRHEEKIHNHRMMKLYLTDGTQDIIGIEYRTMRNLTCDITPGCKILLKGPVDCRRGVVLLQEHHVEVLGGEVEDLVSANSLPRVLNQLLGVTDAGLANTRAPAPDNIPPVPEHCMANTIEEPNVPIHNNISRLSDTGKNSGQSTLNARQSSSIETNFLISPSTSNLGRDSTVSAFNSRNISSVDRNAFERNITKDPLNSNRPVAVVTGIPIVDNFDDEIDLDEIAAIEEQVTKNNKRLLNETVERRSSVEKKLKVNQSKANEFPADEDLFDDVDEQFQDIFERTVKSTPIKIPAEPFTYIKHIKELNESQREGKIFKIKGQISKLLSKLAIGKEGWRLRCTLIDGTGNLDVDFTSDVLTKLVGYSPSQMNKMKREIAVKPELKETAVAALNAAKVNLQSLNCIIEITYAGGPKITELITFSDRHATLLQDRVRSTNL